MTCRHCGQSTRMPTSERGERIRQGQMKAKEEGRHIGRPRTIDRVAIQNLRAAGGSLRQIARQMSTNPNTVIRTLKEARSHETK